MTTKWVNHFIPITWEQMVNGVLEFDSSKEINEFYGKKFKEKYLDLEDINY